MPVRAELFILFIHEHGFENEDGEDGQNETTQQPTGVTVTQR